MRTQKLVRLAVLQHLRTTYGIRIKNSRGEVEFDRRESANEAKGKLFGVPISELPQSFVPGFGNIPSFLVDACTCLEKFAYVEGLFRKSGSCVRLKALKSKLDCGETCLDDALSCDISGLLKQFFRELPQPILPVDLQEALIKAQQLETEKNTATILISCLMPNNIISILRYFFNFLMNISLRADENMMDSGNLAVILAPNLFQSSDGQEKMSANTEKKLRLQVAVIKTFIDNATAIGGVPEFILEKVPVMLGLDGSCSSQAPEDYEESEYESSIAHKRKRRKSIGYFVSGALNKLKSNRTPSSTPQREKIALQSVTPVFVTPNTKRKLPMDSSHDCSSKKRKSILDSFNIEFLPSSLFHGVSTPASVQFVESPGTSSQNSASPIAVSGNLSNTSVQRRSKRIASKKVCRVESGKAGCFSPKISRKEKLRRSLRLKFSLKKNSRDVNRCSGMTRYEHVGRRLASQQDFKNRIQSVKTGLLFSPDVDERLTKKGSKHISKSEENLLTPEQTDGVNYHMSWTRPNNTSFQEISTNETSLLVGTFDKESNPSGPVHMVEMSPEFSCEVTDININDQHENSPTENSINGDENNLTTETLVKVQKAFSESGSNLNTLISDKPTSEYDSRKENLNEISSVEFISEENIFEAKDYDEVTMISKEKHDENHNNKEDSIVLERNFLFDQIQNQVKDTTMESHTVQKTIKSDESLHLNTSLDYLNEQEFPSNDKTNKELPVVKEIITIQEIKTSIKENEANCSNSKEVVTKSLGHISKLQKPRNIRRVKQQSLVQTCDKTLSGDFQMSEHGKVSDHIHWFNKLSLNDSRTESKVKSPLKFQRTPVRQSVRRINSLIEVYRQPERYISIGSKEMPSPLVKSVSCDGALSSHTENTSSTSSAALCYLDHNKQEQKSMSIDQSSTEPTSKSSMELSSKSYSVVRKLSDSWNTSVRPSRVCKQKVILGSQIKPVLDDLTNHESLKSVVNTSTTFSVGTQEKNVVRKTSGRERVWYKGSPKNPIAKVQLLPTTKPLEL